MRRPSLRAGMPQAVEAEIGPGRRIVGAISLCAVGRVTATARNRPQGPNSAVVGVAGFVVIGVAVARVIIVARSAVIGVGGPERSDRNTRGERAGEKAVAMETAMPGAGVAGPGRAAASPRRACDRTCAHEAGRWRRRKAARYWCCRKAAHRRSAAAPMAATAAPAALEGEACRR